MYMRNFLSTNLNLKITVERSKRRSYFLSLVFIPQCFSKNLKHCFVQKLKIMITLFTRRTTKSTSLSVNSIIFFSRNLTLRIRRHRLCEFVTFLLVRDKVHIDTQIVAKIFQNMITYATINLNRKKFDWAQWITYHYSTREGLIEC